MKASSHHGGSTASTGEVRAPRLFDRVRGRMCRLSMARRIKTAYLSWIQRFILTNDRQHPDAMGASEAERFLIMLAVQRHVAASTQSQALAALLFLYREVLGLELSWMKNTERAKRPQRLPVVLSRGEMSLLLGGMTGVTWLLASLLYGSGVRLMECLRLRVKDLDFSRYQITGRHGKGGKDRRTMFPVTLVKALQPRGYLDKPTAQSGCGVACSLIPCLFT